jgi:hypothetical protein
MTRNVMLYLAQGLRRKSERSIAAIKKISSAHVTIGLVAAAWFTTVYALETKAVPASKPSEMPFWVFR